LDVPREIGEHSVFLGITGASNRGCAASSTRIIQPMLTEGHRQTIGIIERGFARPRRMSATSPKPRRTACATRPALPPSRRCQHRDPAISTALTRRLRAAVQQCFRQCPARVFGSAPAEALAQRFIAVGAVVPIEKRVEHCAVLF
jgi:hypothetical protein